MERQSVADSPTAYGGNWFESRMAGALASPQRVVPLLIELAEPRSVLDVGCGPGTWLEEFIGQGVDDVVGIEGDWLDTSVARIPAEKLVLHDVTTPLDLGRSFDLALSLEVGEHIPETAASELVQTLTRHADVVVFSAAAPLQGGTHHVNERWPGYWTDLFDAHGFVAIDVLRPRIWLDDQIAWYYRQNMFLAVRREALARYASLRAEYERAGGRVLPLVHPDRYVRIAKASPVRLKDNAMGTIYDRWPAAREVRDKLRRLLATGS